MAKKGSKKKASVAKEKTESSLPAICLEDNRPETSQYIQPAIELRIGSHSYTVPQFLLARYPKIPTLSPFSFGKTIELTEVNDDVGHTLVNYFYWGTYETLKPRGATGLMDNEIEYRRGVLTYHAARLYDIEGLAKHALGAIDRFGTYLSIAQILDALCNVYAKLPEDEIWLPEYLRNQVEIAFDLDERFFASEEFLKHINENATFSRALVQTMGNIYSGKLSRATNARGPDQRVAKPLGEEGLHEEEPPEEEVPSEEKEDVTPDMYAEELLVDGDFWGTWGAKDKGKQEEMPGEPVTEADQPLLSILENKTVNADGMVYNADNVPIGKCTEGEIAVISRRQYKINAQGMVMSRLGKCVGQCVLLHREDKAGDPTIRPPQAEKGKEDDERPPNPETEAAVESELELGLEPQLEPQLEHKGLTLASLDGRSLERNGNILNDDGQIIGRLVAGLDKLHLLFKNNAKCDAEGKVQVKGKQVPRARVEVVILEEPAATDSQDLVLLDAMDEPAQESQPPTYTSIAGKKLDEFGRIYNDDNVLIARLVKGNTRTLYRKGAHCNAAGDVIVNGKREKFAKIELVHLDEREDVAPNPITELESAIEPGVCLEQVEHLRDEGGWRTCQICLALIRQRSIQLLSEDVATEGGPPPPVGVDLQVC